MSRFPIVLAQGGFPVPWNLHRIALSQLPIYDIEAKQLDQWFRLHTSSILSIRERDSLKEGADSDHLALVKDNIRGILRMASGTMDVTKQVFLFQDEDETKDPGIDGMVLFVRHVRYDVPASTVVCDGFVLIEREGITEEVDKRLDKLLSDEEEIHYVSLRKGEAVLWRQLIPAFSERCRTWSHTQNCERPKDGSSTAEHPWICQCGRGQDTDVMAEEADWKVFAPFTTRVALSPLFAVSYLEHVLRQPSNQRCVACGGKGKPKLQVCTSCKNTRYCSKECQKRDWQAHKTVCKA
jgi:hypothetical protein